MLLARLPDGAIARAIPHAEGRCPGCDAPVTPKCGRQVIWHWAHRPDQLAACDRWSEPETEWHLGWKLRALEAGCAIEVTMRRGEEWHRADIVRPDGVIIEVQHSALGEGEALDREAFYRRQGGLIWLWDARERWYDQVADSHGVWTDYSQTIASLAAPMYWDAGFDDGSLVAVALGVRAYDYLELGLREHASPDELFIPEGSPVVPTITKAQLMAPANAWRLLDEHCFTCGAAPIGRFRDDSPRYDCHLRDPERHIERRAG